MKPVPMYLYSVVTFDNKASDARILNTWPTVGADRAHHTHQKSEGQYWEGFARVTGGRYTALEALDLVSALVEVAERKLTA